MRRGEGKGFMRIGQAAEILEPGSGDSNSTSMLTTESLPEIEQAANAAHILFEQIPRHADMPQHKTQLERNTVLLRVQDGLLVGFEHMPRLVQRVLTAQRLVHRHQRQRRTGVNADIADTEAYRAWADRAEVNRDVRNVAQLLDRYALEVVPTKALDTQDNNKRAIKVLRNKFGTAPVSGGVKPQHVYQYADMREAKGAAQKEIALLSHAFTKAVEWGYIDKHPFKGEVRLEGSKTKTRYIEDWEVVECLALPFLRKRGSVQAIQAYIKIKLLTGMRRGDLLRLRMSSVEGEGIRTDIHKTGKPIILVKMVTRAKASGRRCQGRAPGAYRAVPVLQ